jgi:hypothetical protein
MDLAIDRRVGGSAPMDHANVGPRQMIPVTVGGG